MQNDVERLRRSFSKDRAELFHAEARAIPCRELLQRYTALVDRIILEIYGASCRFADNQARRGARSKLALAATGGYGRGELNPFSDIDIAFIPREEEDPWVEAAVHMAFRLVMDVFLSFREIHVGYSFRPVREVPTLDLVTRTALLDARHLCGDGRLTDSLLSRLRRNLSPLDLMLDVQGGGDSEIRAVSASLYSVEPNLKRGRGSLRDLHYGRWIFMLLLKQQGDSLFSSLTEKGYLDQERIREVEAAAAWFWRARNWLHLVSNKRTDVLINNLQDRIARELGGVSSQEWLAEHYGHAETLARFRDAAAARVLQGPLNVGGIRLRQGYLHLRRNDFERPVPALQLSKHYGIPVSLADMRALENLRRKAEKVTEPTREESWSLLGILGDRPPVSHAIRTLTGLGLMDRYVDHFSQVMRYAPPDPAHNFTVGEHSLKIVEHLENLRMAQNPEGARFCDLARQCAHYDMLYLAALVHDAGKLQAGEDHSEAGLAIATKVARRLELPAEKREILEIVVRHHLLLVRTARLQDLKSPAVIQAVAERVRGVDALRHLYVFTYADTRAVSETNWTSLDYRDLEELYARVQDLLSGESPEGAKPLEVEDRLGKVRSKLLGSKLSNQEALRTLCDAMPASYVLNTPLDEIALHVQLLDRLESEGVVLDIYNRPGDDYSELTICAYDDPEPGMLAKITGVLYGCSTSIQKAQVFTLEKERPVILDTLWVRASGLQLSERRAARVQAGLRDVLSGSDRLERFLEEMGKRPPMGIFLDSIDLRNDLSEDHTVVHVIARDLQGLLYLMTRVLSSSGLHIHSAKVATWNGRAENNFYVTRQTGGQIPDAELRLWRGRLSGMFGGKL